METPTAMAAGLVLTLFGSALLLWCAVELRLRHHLRRHGVAATARVVADAEAHLAPYGEASGELDSAPLLRYTAAAPVGLTVGRELWAVEDGTGPGETVLARPRGHTPLRRPARLVPGTIVQVAYDARRPSRVVLAAVEGVRTLPGDIFWALLAAAALAGGLSLLSLTLTR